MIRPGWRRATSDEATSDYLKRRAALDAAIERGIYSTREVEAAEADLALFAGYDRLDHVDGGL